MTELEEAMLAIKQLMIDVKYLNTHLNRLYDQTDNLRYRVIELEKQLKEKEEKQ